MSAKISFLKRNIIANFFGNTWTGIMGIIFVPLYMKFLGSEAYGLLGIFTSLITFSSLLDMGLSNTLNRELAILVSLPNKAHEMRNLVRTLEIPYWIIGILIFVATFFASSFIAYDWVKVSKLSRDTVQMAVIIMGFAMAFQWPLSFYSGGLMGLQHQVLLNVINSIMATFRGLGAVLILWLVSPSVEAFFIWQIVSSIIHTGLVAFYLWNRLPASNEKTNFDKQALIKIWRFAAGVTGITVLALLLTQMDKVILSHMLSLEAFGYYTLAQLVAFTLFRFFGPIYEATYPKLCNLVALNDEKNIVKLYHESSQLLSVVVIPAAVVLSFFSKEVIMLWTQNSVTTQNSYLLVSILVIGTACNGIMHIPAALQLAKGWTKLSFYVNLVSVIILIPLMYFLTKWYGSVGAASIWLILNAGYVLITIQLMHRKLIPAEKLRWYFNDVGLPLISALSVVCVFRYIFPVPVQHIGLFIYMFFISITTLTLTAFATPVTREFTLTKLLNFIKNNDTKSYRAPNV